MNIIGTHINYYFICHRKLWLFANGITMEQTSDTVYEGKLIHENAYSQRAEKYEELEIDGCKIDFFDARNGIVHEIKKSEKMEAAHEWQVKYYLFVLAKHGVKGTSGILEYPTLRQTKAVELTENDIQEIERIKKEVEQLCESEQCPPCIHSTICKRCSYYEFCYIEEE